MRIAMISEHASPLAVLGGVDAGGQNGPVAALSLALGRRGHDGTVYTRPHLAAPAAHPAARRKEAPMRIAMISEHASPLAVLGGVDAGGQNVHVAALSLALGRRGHDVTVYTRRDDPALEERVAMSPNVEVVHVNAGPIEAVPKDDLLPYMGELADGVAADARRVRPEILHSHFWMSGVAAREAANRLDIPMVHTFHALGVVKRRHQGADDTSPIERRWLEPRVGREADGV